MRLMLCLHSGLNSRPFKERFPMDNSMIEEYDRTFVRVQKLGQVDFSFIFNYVWNKLGEN